MPELRWALIVLGLVLVAGVYLYSRRQTADARRERAGEERREPVLGGASAEAGADEVGTRFEDGTPEAETDLEPTGEMPEFVREDRTLDATGELPELEPERSRFDAGDAGGAAPDPSATEAPPAERQAPESGVQRIIALRLVARGTESLGADEVVLSLREQGLRHGRYGIFHRFAKEGDEQPMFSAASLTEPGSFDLSTLAETRLSGLSLFMVLPGPCDPVEQFDAMVAAAREMARTLPLELLDETGSSWSIQRERYLREELIRYRHQPYLV
jgi:cell division protein ZipA